jgi:hypothetical protein
MAKLANAIHELLAWKRGSKQRKGPIMQESIIHKNDHFVKNTIGLNAKMGVCIQFNSIQFQNILISVYPRLVTAGIACVMLVVQVMNIWFELVVYNASSYIQREQINGAVYKV